MKLLKEMPLGLVDKRRPTSPPYPLIRFYCFMYLGTKVQKRHFILIGEVYPFQKFRRDNKRIKTNKTQEPKVLVETEGFKDSITMTLQKNNRVKEYVLELEQIQYNHLQDYRTPALQRKFWVKRESLIKKQIEDYLNTYDE